LFAVSNFVINTVCRQAKSNHFKVKVSWLLTAISFE
jgi:hypothetical protein